MRDVVLAAAERAVHPGVDQIEGERRVHADGRMQRGAAAARRGSARRRRIRRRCRSAAAAAARPLQVSDVALADQAGDLDLQALDATNRRSARCRRRAPSSPSTCQGSSAVRSSTCDAARGEIAERGKRNSKCGANHSASQRVAELAAVPRSRRSKSCQTKCGSMKRSCSSVPQRLSRARAVGLLPEARDQRAHQQLLRQAHARVRRHLEGAHLEQAEAAGRRRRASTACRCRTRRGACCR